MTLPATMKAYPLPQFGGPDVLKLQDIALPEPGTGDVLIRVAAAGINAPDLAQRAGHYPPPPGASPLPGLEISGEIVALGPSVTGFGLGDRVIALCNGGGYAEYVAVPAGQVLPAPANWPLAEAAALPETWFTVTQTLVMRAGLDAGMSVLIHGAAGGIGGAAIKIARLCGAHPIAVVSSPEKAAYARSLGAQTTILHTSQDIVQATLEATQGKGVDRVLDIVGGDMAARNIEASAIGGHIVQVSTQGGGNASVPLRLLMSKQLTLSGSTLRPQPAATKAAIAATIRTRFWPAIQQPGFTRPSIEAMAFADAPEAHRQMEDRRFYGKIVLVTDFGRTV